MRPPIVVLAGATASGKTEAALTLARRFGGALVGADSIQVYRGFDVGSAKPRAEELGDVEHHLLDVIDPDEAMDAVEYAGRADEVIAELARRGRVPIVVGGTGLWLRALTRGLVDLPPPDRTLRAQLEAEAGRRGTPALHARLEHVDPEAAMAIHPNDRMRIVRALEVFTQTGIPMSTHQAEHRLGAPRYPGIFIVLERPRETLLTRIRDRTRAMVEAGWANEVRQLLSRWGDAVRPFGSVGYKEMLAHVRDGVDLDETERLIVKATRVYARRQGTWFRGEPDIHMVAKPEALSTPEGLAKVERALTP